MQKDANGIHTDPFLDDKFNGSQSFAPGFSYWKPIGSQGFPQAKYVVKHIWKIDTLETQISIGRKTEKQAP